MIYRDQTPRKSQKSDPVGEVGLNAPKSLFGSGMSLGVLADKMSDKTASDAPAATAEGNDAASAANTKINEMASVADGKASALASAANTKVTEALTSLKKGFGAKDLVGILNQSIINFPTAGYEVPASEKALLQTAASRIKQLASKTVLEVAGYTDNTGNVAKNLVLSQRRAEAVRKRADRCRRVPAQGCAGPAGCSGRRPHSPDTNSRRITPSVCSDLISDKDKDRNGPDPHVQFAFGSGSRFGRLSICLAPQPRVWSSG